MSASVNEEDKSIAQASGQHVVCNTDPGKVPAILSAPPGDTFANKPKMYSAQKIDLDGVGCLDGLSSGGGPGAVSVFGSGRISGQ